MDEVGTLEKGTELTIEYELYQDGIWYGQIYIDNNGYYYIKLEDVMLKNAVFDLNNACKSKEKEEIYVFGDNVYLYSGSSNFYSKVSNSEIPIGTTLSVEYTDCLEYTGPLGRYWVYASYGNLKGWVQVGAYIDSEEESPNVAFVENNKIYIFEDITTLYEKPDYTSKKINVNISKYTEVDYLYKYGDWNYGNGPVDGYIYIKYKNVEGWLYIGGYTTKVEYFSSFSTKGNFKAIVTSEDGLELYTKYNDNNSKTNVKIPLNTEFEFYYQYDSWLYLSYNNNYYWADTKIDVVPDPGISYLFMNGLIAEESDVNFINYNKVSVYNSPNDNAKIINEVPINTELTGSYSIFYGKESDSDYYYADWYYIKKYNGWIKKDSLAFGNNAVSINLYDIIYVYDTPSLNSSYVSVKENTTFKEKYYFYDSDTQTRWIYVEYDNKHGWVNDTENDDALFSSVNYTVKVTTDTALYKSINIRINYLDYIGSIPSGTILKAISIGSYYGNNNSYYLVEYNGQQGWILQKDTEFIKSNEITETLPENKENKAEETELPSIDTSDKKVSVFNKMSSELVISLCIFIALCLSIVALIIIVKVNEKKKKKKLDGEEKQ